MNSTVLEMIIRVFGAFLSIYSFAVLLQVPRRFTLSPESRVFAAETEALGRERVPTSLPCRPARDRRQGGDVSRLSLRPATP